MRWKEIQDNPASNDKLLRRAQIIKLVREFFWQQEFCEMETPIALRFPGQEPYLNPMPVEISDSVGTRFKFYLRTSPEYALKKILCAGLPKIFELGKCFRNEESFGGVHNPEFTMLEWYRAPGALENIMEDTENLFKHLAKLLGREKIIWRGKEVNILQSWERKTMQELWQEYLQVNLDDYLDRENIANLAARLSFTVSKTERYEDIFFKIFLNKIEPFLGMEKPLFLYDYPVQMCSLSKTATDVRYAQRTELYIAGLELANGFGELTDSVIQEKNLENDRQLRVKLGKDIFPVDREFINALQNGKLKQRTKTAAGIALGVDRMVLLFTGGKDINDIIFQSVNDQINN